MPVGKQDILQTGGVGETPQLGAPLEDNVLDQTTEPIDAGQDVSPAAAAPSTGVDERGVPYAPQDVPDILPQEPDYEAPPPANIGLLEEVYDWIKKTPNANVVLSKEEFVKKHQDNKEKLRSLFYKINMFNGGEHQFPKKFLGTQDFVDNIIINGQTKEEEDAQILSDEPNVTAKAPPITDEDREKQRYERSQKAQDNIYMGQARVVDQSEDGQPIYEKVTIEKEQNPAYETPDDSSVEGVNKDINNQLYNMDFEKSHVPEQIVEENKDYQEFKKDIDDVRKTFSEKDKFDEYTPDPFETFNITPDQFALEQKDDRVLRRLTSEVNYLQNVVDAIDKGESYDQDEYDRKYVDVQNKAGSTEVGGVPVAPKKAISSYDKSLREQYPDKYESLSGEASSKKEKRAGHHQENRTKWDDFVERELKKLSKKGGAVYVQSGIHDKTEDDLSHSISELEDRISNEEKNKKKGWENRIDKHTETIEKISLELDRRKRSEEGGLSDIEQKMWDDERDTKIEYPAKDLIEDYKAIAITADQTPQERLETARGRLQIFTGSKEAKETSIKEDVKKTLWTFKDDNKKYTAADIKYTNPVLNSLHQEVLKSLNSDVLGKGTLLQSGDRDVARGTGSGEWERPFFIEEYLEAVERAYRGEGERIAIPKDYGVGENINREKRASYFEKKQRKGESAEDYKRRWRNWQMSQRGRNIRKGKEEKEDEIIAFKPSYDEGVSKKEQKAQVDFLEKKANWYHNYADWWDRVAKGNVEGLDKVFESGREAADYYLGMIESGVKELVDEEITNYNIWKAGSTHWNHKKGEDSPIDDFRGYHDYLAFSSEWAQQKYTEGMKLINEQMIASVKKGVDELKQELNGQMKADMERQYDIINKTYEPLYDKAIEGSEEAQRIKKKYSYLIKNITNQVTKDRLIADYNKELQQIEEVKEVYEANQAKIDEVRERSAKVWQTKFDFAFDNYSRDVNKEVFDRLSDYIQDNFIAGYNSQYGVRDWVADNIDNTKEFNYLPFSGQKKFIEDKWVEFRDMLTIELSKTTKRVPANIEEESLPYYEWTKEVPLSEEELNQRKTSIIYNTGERAKKEFTWYAMDRLMYDKVRSEGEENGFQMTVFAIKNWAEAELERLREFESRTKGAVKDLARRSKGMGEAWGNAWGFYDASELMYGTGTTPTTIALGQIQNIKSFDDARIYLEEIINKGYDDSFWDGFWGGVSTHDSLIEYIPFLSSFNELGSSINLYRVSQKLANNMPLTEAERSLLDSYGMLNQINSMIPTGHGRSTGQTIKYMIPFIIEFAATFGAVGVGTKAAQESAEALVKYKLKKALKKQIAKELSEKTGKKATKAEVKAVIKERAMSRGNFVQVMKGQKWVDDYIEKQIKGGVDDWVESQARNWTYMKFYRGFVGSIALTTVHPDRYLKETYDLMTPEMAIALSGGLDDVAMAINKNGMSFTEAFIKGYGKTWSEYATELIGASVIRALPKGAWKKIIGNPQWVERLWISKWLKLKNMTKDELYDDILRTRTSYDGIPAETMEELLNEVFSDIIMGRDVGITKREFEDIFLATVIFGKAMKGIQIGVKGGKAIWSHVRGMPNVVTISVRVKDEKGNWVDKEVTMNKKDWKDFRDDILKSNSSVESTYGDLLRYLEKNNFTQEQKDLMTSAFIDVRGKDIVNDPRFKEIQERAESETGISYEDNINELNNPIEISDTPSGVVEETSEQIEAREEIEKIEVPEGSKKKKVVKQEYVVEELEPAGRAKKLGKRYKGKRGKKKSYIVRSEMNGVVVNIPSSRISDFIKNGVLTDKGKVYVDNARARIAKEQIEKAREEGTIVEPKKGTPPQMELPFEDVEAVEETTEDLTEEMIPEGVDKKAVEKERKEAKEAVKKGTEVSTEKQTETTEEYPEADVFYAKKKHGGLVGRKYKTKKGREVTIVNETNNYIDFQDEFGDIKRLRKGGAGNYLAVFLQGETIKIDEHIKPEPAKTAPSDVVEEPKETEKKPTTKKKRKRYKPVEEDPSALIDDTKTTSQKRQINSMKNAKTDDAKRRALKKYADEIGITPEQAQNAREELGLTRTTSANSRLVAKTFKDALEAGKTVEQVINAMDAAVGTIPTKAERGKTSVDKQKKKDEYKKTVEEGDAAMKNKNYQEAIDIYKKAVGTLPTMKDTSIKNKIKKAQDLLKREKAEQKAEDTIKGKSNVKKSNTESKKKSPETSPETTPVDDAVVEEKVEIKKPTTKKRKPYTNTPQEKAQLKGINKQYTEDKKTLEEGQAKELSDARKKVEIADKKAQRLADMGSKDTKSKNDFQAAVNELNELIEAHKKQLADLKERNKKKKDAIIDKARKRAEGRAGAEQTEKEKIKSQIEYLEEASEQIGKEPVLDEYGEPTGEYAQSDFTNQINDLKAKLAEIEAVEAEKKKPKETEKKSTKSTGRSKVFTDLYDRLKSYTSKKLKGMPLEDINKTEVTIKRKKQKIATSQYINNLINENKISLEEGLVLKKMYESALKEHHKVNIKESTPLSKEMQSEQKTQPTNEPIEPAEEGTFSVYATRNGLKKLGGEEIENDRARDPRQEANKLKKGESVIIVTEQDGKKTFTRVSKSKDNVGRRGFVSVSLTLPVSTKMTTQQAQEILDEKFKEIGGTNATTQTVKKADLGYKSQPLTNKGKVQKMVTGETTAGSFVQDVLDRLKKAFPNIEVITDLVEFNKAAIETGMTAEEIMNTPAFKWQGKIYINPERVSPETKVHEFGHLWGAIAKTVSPKLYNAGLALVKGTSYYTDLKEKIEKNPELYTHLVSEQDILDEALATAIGEKGAALLEKEQSSAYAKFMEIFSRLFREIKRALGIEASMNLNDLTLNQYTKKVAKELLGKMPISKISSEKLAELETERAPSTKDVVDRGLLKANWGVFKNLGQMNRIWFTEKKGVNKELYRKKEKIAAEISLWNKKGYEITYDYSQATTEALNEKLGTIPERVYATMKKTGVIPEGMNNKLKERAELRTEIGKAVNTYLSAHSQGIEGLKVELKELGISEASASAIAETAQQMKNLRDEVSAALKETVSSMGFEELEATLTENEGLWLHRSYKMFDDPNWSKNWQKIFGEEAVMEIRKGISEMYSSKNNKARQINVYTDSMGNLSFEVSSGNDVLASYPTPPKQGNKLSEQEMKDLLEKMYDKPQDRKKVWDELTNYKGINGAAVNLSEVEGVSTPNVVSGMTFELNNQQINEVIDKVLSKGRGFVADSKKSSGGTAVGIKNIYEGTIFKERKDIPPVIMKLMGLYTSPEINFTKSIDKAATWLAKGKLEQQVFNMGITEVGENTFAGTFMQLENKDRGNKFEDEGGQEWIKVTSSQSALMGKLAEAEVEGKRKYVYMTPEMHVTLYGITPETNTWANRVNEKYLNLPFINMINGWWKASLTLFAPASQARNFVGAYVNLLASGNMSPTILGDIPKIVNAAMIATNDFTAAQHAASWLASPLGVSKLFGWAYANAHSKEGKEQIREQWKKDYLEAVKYGLIGESIEGSVIEQNANRIFDETLRENVGVSAKELVQKAFRQGQKDLLTTAGKPYQSTDAIFKIIQFKNETKRFEKMYAYMLDSNGGTMTQEEFNEFVKDKAADLTRKEQPTYSKTSEFMKGLSKSSIIGSFVMWQAQLYKTRGAILLHAYEFGKEAIRLRKEAKAILNDPNATNEQIAQANLMLEGAKVAAAQTARKLAGTVAAMSLTPLLVATGMAMTGTTDEEDEAIAQNSAWYDKNASRFYTKKPTPFNKEDGGMKFEYVDLTFLDPSSQFHKMWKSFSRGEGFTGVAKEFVNPFTGKEIGFDKLIRAITTGKDEYGNALWETTDSDLITSFKAIGYVLPVPLEKEVDLIWKSIKGDVRYDGREYHLDDEILALATGVKTKTGDLAAKYSSTINRKIREFEGVKREFDYNYVKDLSVSNEEMSKKLEEKNKWLSENWHEIKNSTNSMMQVEALGELKVKGKHHKEGVREDFVNRRKNNLLWILENKIRVVKLTDEQLEKRPTKGMSNKAGLTIVNDKPWQMVLEEGEDGTYKVKWNWQITPKKGGADVKSKNKELKEGEYEEGKYEEGKYEGKDK